METTNFINVTSPLTWDEYFMIQAMTISFKSKDPNTKVGCVIVDQNNRQKSAGYNGMVAGIDESKIPWGNDKSKSLSEQKYPYVIHSEANAVDYAKTDLTGCRIYVTLFPCSDCSKRIANNGIKEVIFLSDKYKFTPDNNAAKYLLDLCGIKYRQFTPDKKTIRKFSDYIFNMINP